MKKLICAIAALLLALSLLAGCSAEQQGIEGRWLSIDGSTLTFADGKLTLTDADGEGILAEAEYPCDYRDGFLYITIGGVEVKAFSVTLSGGELELVYTPEVLADMQAEGGATIQLERAKD